MAQSVSGQISIISRFLHQNTADLSVTYSATPTLDFEKTLSTTDVTKLYYKRYSVTTTPTVIDVTALTDAYGAAVNFGTIKHIHIVNNDATNSLTAGGGTDPVFGALPTITAAGCVAMTASFSISPTAKNIALTASAGTILVDVIFTGT